MKAAELRLGNIVKAYGRVSEVCNLSTTFVGVRYIKNFAKKKEPLGAYGPEKFVHPIPITTEILLKLGWTDTGKGDDFHSGHLWVIPGCDYVFEQGFGFVDNKGPYGHYCDIGYEPIEYVHQLQNMYFLLFRTELKIEL